MCSSSKHILDPNKGSTDVEVVEYISGRLQADPFNGAGDLVIDQTGARAAADMFRAAKLNPIGVTLTGGETEHKHSSREFSVPKANLINLLDVKLNTKELEIVHDLPDMESLERELTDYRRRISNTGHVTFNAREGSHDDVVIAVALATWWASRERQRVGMVKVLYG